VSLYAALAAGLAFAAFCFSFSQFAPYDDEGTMLVAIKSFVQGDPLYSGLYTLYGPFFYELYGGFTGSPA
jgi:hypothetical protein